MRKIILLSLCLSMLLGFNSCNHNINNSNTGNNSISNSQNSDTSFESTNSNLSNSNIEIEDKESRELYICIPEDKKLNVVQLADIHFGIEGKDWHNDKVDRTKRYIQYIIDNQKPDLIVCSGDNILSTGINGITTFIEMMEEYKTPWIWIYGNHDAENDAFNYRKSDLSYTLMHTDTNYLLYKEGYVEEGIEDRYGNFSVSIYNQTKEKLLGAFIIMDAGEYDYSSSQYQTITNGQIDWYKHEIDELQSKYVLQENNQYEIIPTIIFSHIQLPEFYNAYINAQDGTSAEFVINQELSSSEISEIANGGPKINNGFFDTIVEKQSTKAYLVGHAHTFYFQVKYKGVILGFAPQTGFSKLFANNNEARKTYIYQIAEDLTFDTICIDEIVKNKGLVFSSTNGDGNAIYDEETGLYVFTTQLGLWNRVSIDFYGDEYTTDFVRLNQTNTSFTGMFNPDNQADWTTNLYFSDITSGELICSNSTVNIYKFVYNPKEKTLNIEIVENPIIEEGDIQALSANKNSELTVWNKANFVVKSEKNSWCSTLAKLFIVVDSEGRICYSSSSTGYGDLTTDYYYVHPYYETDRDYTTNPAIKITDSGYKIIVPEGGFAISAYGESLIALAKIVLDPTYSKASKISTIVNNRNAYNENLRIAYNADTKIISTSYSI